MANRMTDIGSQDLNKKEGQVLETVLELTAAGYSDPVMLPFRKISSLVSSVYGAGTGNLQFTQDSEALIDAGLAEWEDWDGVDEINPGLLAFRLKSTSGAVTGKVTVKSFNII